MASLAAILKQLVTLTRAAVLPTIPNAIIGSEWPSTELRKKAKEAGAPVIAILHKLTNYKAREMPFEMSETACAETIQGIIGDPSFAPGHTTTLQVAFANDATTVKEGDLISCIFWNDGEADAATYKAGANETLASVAAGLKANIDLIMPDLDVTISGTIITLNNPTQIGYLIQSNAGQTFIIEEATRWAIRNLQINAWTGSLELKYQVNEIVEDFLSSLDAENGFAMPSGMWVDLDLMAARPEDNDTDKNIFTDMYLFNIEHWSTYNKHKWAVVAAIPAKDENP